PLLRQRLPQTGEIVAVAVDRIARQPPLDRQTLQIAVEDAPPGGDRSARSLRSHLLGARGVPAFGEGRRDVPVRFSTTLKGRQLRDVSSKGTPRRPPRIPGPRFREADAGRKHRRPREGDVPTAVACERRAEKDWDVSTPSAGRSPARGLLTK